MKKRTLITLALIALATHGIAADPIGLIVSLQGTAQAISLDGKTRPLEIKSDIFLNDTLRTDLQSKLQILFNDDSIFAQGENSEMTIDEYIFNPNTAPDNAFGVKLRQGLFRTVTGKITDLNPERFKVKTSRSTIGIRGCDLGFEITPTEDHIAVITVPLGKAIYINPKQGGKGIVLKTPRFIVIGERGNPKTRPLRTEDRKRTQEGTTPKEENPPEDPDEQPPTEPGDDPQKDDSDPEEPDGSGSPQDDGSDETPAPPPPPPPEPPDDILDDEDTLDPEPSDPEPVEYILSATELETIRSGTITYELTGAGTATADIHTFDPVNGGQDFTVNGAASVNVEIGNGAHSAEAHIGRLGNETGQSLELDLTVDLLTDAANVSALNMQANGSWNETDLIQTTADIDLHGTGTDTAPTAAQLDANLVLERGTDDWATIDLSTSKIELE